MKIILAHILITNWSLTMMFSNYRKTSNRKGDALLCEAPHKFLTQTRTYLEVFFKIHSRYWPLISFVKGDINIMKFLDSMKNLYELYVIRNCLHIKNSWQRVEWSYFETLHMKFIKYNKRIAIWIFGCILILKWSSNALPPLYKKIV